MQPLAIHQVCTFRWTLEQDLATYRRLGVTQVGVWRQKLSDHGEEKGGDLIREAGLGVSSYHWAGGFTGSDVHSYEESMQDAILAVQMAAKLRANCLVVHPGARGFHMKGHLRRLLQEAYSELVDYAKRLNVSVAIEPIPVPEGTGWTILHQVEDAVGFVHDVAPEDLKIVLDLYHHRHELHDLSWLPEIAPYISCVQIADAEKVSPPLEADRRSLGRGDLPLRQVISTLCEAGYTGPWELELAGPEIESGDYECLLQDNLAAFEGICGP